VALAYVGAVVGAGFASGQEIYQFFSRHGTWGWAGLVLAGIGFFLLGWLGLEAGRRGLRDFHTFLRHTYPGRVAAPLESLATVFLASGLVVVTAAGGQTLHDLLGIPTLPAGFVTLFVMVWVAGRGAAGLLGANAVLVPLMTGVALAVALMAPSRWSGPGAPHWWLSAGLYVSYNLFTGLMVLLGIGSRLRSAGETRAAAALGALVLTGLGMAMHRALLAMPPTASLPLLSTARHLGAVWGWLFGAALYAALFTTGVAEAFALFARFGRRAWGALFLWPASWVGFGLLVARLYPAMGMLAVLFWVPLVCRPGRRGLR
jgi:uncharacterized membrane protein YkvI